MSEKYWKPTVHSMKRRSFTHEYSRRGIYHVTVCVDAGLHQPLGRMAGQLDKPDGDADAPHVVLTAIGEMVAAELRASISRFYPMLEVQDFIIMPEHLHFLLVAHGNIVSRSGKPTHLGHVIAGFKQGCNRRYWALTGQEAGGPDQATKSPGAMADAGGPDLATKSPGAMADAGGYNLATKSPGAMGDAGRVPGVFGDSVAEKGGRSGAMADDRGKVGRVRSRGLQPLFDAGYCDVMPVDAEQLATQRAYIRGNPRSRLLRMSNRAWLQPRRRTVDTAVTLSALYGYLQRECGRALVPGAFEAIAERLIVGESGDEIARHRASSEEEAVGEIARHRGSREKEAVGEIARHRASSEEEAVGEIARHRGSREKEAVGKERSGGHVLCDSYGNATLLGRRLLPVVCHRRDAGLFATQKARCLAAAAEGAVLVSARIAKGEQEIMDTALLSGYPVVRIEDNGFLDIYHPSADRLDDCAASLLLLVTPWQYRFRGADEGVSVPFCKTMNCVAQALCRTRDDWWKRS